MNEQSSGLGAELKGCEPVFIGSGCHINGNATFSGPTTINCSLEGELFVKGALTIGGDAVVKARIAAERVTVAGRVIGDIEAEVSIKLLSSAAVSGNITAPSVVIEDGATFEGYCSMPDDYTIEVIKVNREASDVAVDSNALNAAVSLLHNE